MTNSAPIAFIGEMGLHMTWGDPIDLLTWNIPELKTVLVSNHSDLKNAMRGFWLFETSMATHRTMC